MGRKREESGQVMNSVGGRWGNVRCVRRFEPPKPPQASFIGMIDRLQGSIRCCHPKPHAVEPSPINVSLSAREAGSDKDKPDVVICSFVFD